jgi:hypothetical protein
MPTQPDHEIYVSRSTIEIELDKAQKAVEAGKRMLKGLDPRESTSWLNMIRNIANFEGRITVYKDLLQGDRK